jgi:hypothetical protein
MTRVTRHRACDSGAAATFAHSDSTMPNTNANHTAHRPPARRPWPDFHSSTVAVVNNPSTINGQIAAVASSAPNRNANSRPWRYEAYAAPSATSAVQAHAPTAPGPVEPGLPWCSPQLTSRRTPHLVRAAADAGEHLRAGHRPPDRHMRDTDAQVVSSTRHATPRKASPSACNPANSVRIFSAVTAHHRPTDGGDAGQRQPWRKPAVHDGHGFV